MALDRTSEGLLEAVRASPRAVDAHDKAAWVALFAADAAVNDPVGSRAHVGTEAIARFYEAFIGPNTIAFQVARDIVAGQTVVRDLHIQTTMSTGATVTVPMHLRYDLVEVDGEWRIARLAAHWELAVMVARLLGTGTTGMLAGAKLGPHLVGELGMGGAIGMMRALRGVGGHGKRLARQMFAVAAAGDARRLRELLGDEAVVDMTAGQSMTAAEFASVARDMEWDKMIAAGRTVSVSVRVGDSHGVAFVEFAPSSSRIEAVQIFLDRGP